MKSISSGLLIGTLVCAGCATSYDSSTFLTGGYSETKLAPDVVRVVFRGNTSTSKERTQDLALMRAADLSLQAGFPYFTVLEETNDRSQDSSGGSTISMPKNEILVRFLKEKPAGVLAYDATFLTRTLKEKYKIK